MATVEVHGDVRQVQLLDGVDGALKVGVLSTGTCEKELVFVLPIDQVACGQVNCSRSAHRITEGQ